MKKTKIIIPALGLLLLSTAASVTGTVAWFSANASVTASGMQVKAKAEEGIVISNAASGTYDVSATTANTGIKELKPASTWNCSDWYHSTSTNPASANTTQAYSAIASGDATSHYAVHDFYIRSSAAEAITVTSLDVSSVTVTGSPAQDLSKALRVGVVFEDDADAKAYIYGPVTGFTASYSVHQSSDGDTAHTKAVTAVASNTVSKCTGVTSIPNNTTNGTHASVYVWFEGEDAACISNNIVASLETLEVSVVFSYSK